MEQFRIREDGFREIRQKMVARLLFIFIPSFAAAIIFVQLSAKPGDPDTLPYVMPLLALVIGYSMYAALKKNRTSMESYSLTIGDASIVRVQSPLPDLHISFTDISRISKIRNGNIIIVGKHRDDMIIVYRQIESYDALEQRLQQLYPFTAPPAYSIFNHPLFSLVVVAAMICFYAFQNKIVTAICGPALAGVMTWALISIQRNKNLDAKTRRLSWIVLLPLASIIYITILILTGNK